MSTLSATGITDVGLGESKVFVSAHELQLDSSTEDSSSSLLIEGRHDSSHPSRFNGTALGPAQDHGTDLPLQDLSASPLNCALAMDPADRMNDQVAADILAANTGESKVFVSAHELQLDSSTEDSSSSLLIEGRHDSSHPSRFNGTALGPAQDHGTDLPLQDLSASPLNCALAMDPADRMNDQVAADILAANTGVLSEEQIRLKKMKRQEDETARTSTLPQNHFPGAEAPKLTPEQLEMIEKLVAVQKQCNKSSFIDRLKVTKMKRQEDETARTSTLPQNHFPGAEAPKLTPEQLEMIEKLVAVQKQCNKSSFIDRLKVTPWPQSQDPLNREVRQQRFAHFTELAIMSVQEIVDFAKQLPGFLELTREDQIALLKTSTIEIMLVESSRRYNPAMECITFLKDFSYNKEDFAKAGLQLEFINPIFEFSKGMNDLHLDEAEFALLIAINIFSADRPNVQDHDLVERLQQPYVDALHSYTRIKRPNDHLMFPRMLMKLVSLRTLSSVHSEQVFALRLQDKKLPPLLSEIWDVHE
ncbi:UNVERIFIED_CONTAM: hypothetical protein FKN15_021071 [Acipenser sinensis]